MSKTCTKCHSIKTIDNYYKHRATCKTCFKQYNNKNYQKKTIGPKKYNIDPESFYNELEHLTQMELSKKYNIPQSTVSFWKIHKSTYV